VAAKQTKAPKSRPRGKMPVKRSINLMLVEEGKISAAKAIPAILAIIVLAGLFGKFLVADRLASMSKATGKVSRLQDQLDDTMDALENYDNVEDTYAHYTYDGMTRQELNLVDRTLVLDLVVSILPEVEPGPSEADIERMLDNMFRDAPATGDPRLDQARLEARRQILEQLIPVPEYVINGWNVTDNLLTVDVTGQTLERMNELGRQIEQSPIVDSCTIVTAKKDDRKKNQQTQEQEGVKTRFIVYLQQPPEADGEEVSQP